MGEDMLRLLSLAETFLTEKWIFVNETTQLRCNEKWYKIGMLENYENVRIGPLKSFVTFLWNVNNDITPYNKQSNYQ